MNGNIIVKENCKYLENTIVGTSVNEFVTLPSRARISIIYLSGEKGEGFFGLKRLWKTVYYIYYSILCLQWNNFAMKLERFIGEVKE